MTLTAETIGSIRPVIVARALVEAGDPMIRRAWSYISGWAALERAGVPSRLRRELLGPKFVEAETEALQRVRQWSGSRARSCLAVVGDMGVGKSYAGAEWLLDRYRHGLGIMWVSCPSWAKLPLERGKRDEDRHTVILADEERRALGASAVVVDDLGSGNLSPFMLERINTLLIERDAAGKPTLVLLNKVAPAKVKAKPVEGDPTRAPVDPIQLIDPRVIDRMRGGGGTTVRLPTAKSRRVEEPEDELDDDGHGRSWRAAVAVIETVGCMDNRGDGSSWFRGQRQPILEPVFGWRSERVIEGPGWIEVAEQVRLMLRADAGEVIRIADALAQQDQAFAGLGLLPSFLQSLEQHTAGDRQRDTSERVRLRVDSDYLRRAERTQSAGSVMGRTDPAPTQDETHALPDGRRAQLASFGVSVRFCSALNEWEARYKRKTVRGEPESLLANDGTTSEFSRALRRKYGRLLGTAETERGAWWIASQVFEQPEVDAFEEAHA